MRGVFLLALTLSATACAPLSPRQGSADAVWWPSPNYELRRANFVILHHTSNDNPERALTTLTNPFSGVSSHYLITREGAVLQLVDENLRAWHAGPSWWGGQTDMNSASIGIELDNTGMEPFPPEQIGALIRLLEEVTARHRIPRANILGHADIAPTRKSDPSAFFPWDALARAGFGLWCDAPESTPPGFDALLGLAALGYDLLDAPAAIAAFRLHFMERAEGVERDPARLDARERDRIACLLSTRNARRRGDEDKNPSASPVQDANL